MLKVLAIAMACLVVWIAAVADAGQSNALLHGARSLPYGDKLGHLGLYGSFALLANLALAPRQIGIGRWRTHLGGVLVLCFAWIEELSQAFFPSRSLDAADALCDLLGVLLAAALASAWLGRACQGKEAA